MTTTEPQKVPPQPPIRFSLDPRQGFAAELRTAIWEAILVKEDRICIDGDALRWVERTERDRLSFKDPGLLHTSKQVRNEALGIYLGRNTFYSGVMKYAETPQEAATWLARLEVALSDSRPVEELRLIQAVEVDVECTTLAKGPFLEQWATICLLDERWWVGKSRLRAANNAWGISVRFDSISRSATGAGVYGGNHCQAWWQMLFDRIKDMARTAKKGSSRVQTAAELVRIAADVVGSELKASVGGKAEEQAAIAVIEQWMAYIA